MRYELWGAFPTDLVDRLLYFLNKIRIEQLIKKVWSKARFPPDEFVREVRPFLLVCIGISKDVSKGCPNKRKSRFARTNSSSAKQA